VTSTSGTKTAPHAAQVKVSLCVKVARAQASSERGHAAQWTVSVWTTGGNVPSAAIRLQATPATAGAPRFSFGCGKDDGTPACLLGAVSAKSAQRQLQAQLIVPVTGSAVTSVRLTVIGSAAHLAKAPKASASVSVTASRSATSPSLAAALPVPEAVTAPLPVGSLPSIPAASPTLSPSGNAAGLFPTLDPKPTQSPSQPARRSPSKSAKQARARPIANTSALPEGAPIVGAQLTGLAALALAFVVVVARMSIRRRTAETSPADSPEAEASDDTKPDA